MPYILSLTSISPIIAETQRHTLVDQAVMQKVTHFISNGWLAKPESVPPEVQSYFPIRDKLIMDDRIFLKGLRVVVSQTLYKDAGILGQMLQREEQEKLCIGLLDARYWFYHSVMKPCNSHKTPPAERAACYSTSHWPSMVPCKHRFIWLKWIAVTDTCRLLHPVGLKWIPSETCCLKPWSHG